MAAAVMERWNTHKLPERLPFSKKKLSKRVIFSYIIDYIIIVVLIVTFYIVDKIEPFHQPFSMDNYTLHYPFAVHERIPVFQLCLICVLCPGVIIAIYTLVIDGLFSHQTPMPGNSSGIRRLSGRYRLKDRLWELNCGILGLGLSVCAAFTITGALKNAIGKPRPDLIDRCKVKPDWEKPENAVGAEPWLLYTIKICTQENNALLQDGFKSFPSGHSSTSFAGLFYLSLYLAAKLHVLDSKGEVWKAFIVLVPTLGACLVAGSRIMDARHHPFDVLSGSLMGILVAWASYRQYFPPLHETWRKGRAYPIRSWGMQPKMPHNPTYHADDDTEPLQLMERRSDEERGEASGFAAAPVAERGAGGSGGNVFREQISQSQRRRAETQQYGVQHSDTIGSTLSTKVSRYQGQLPGSNPFAPAPRRHDAYDYSSSEDDSEYELRQQYPRSQPQQRVYDPVGDTGYHPRTGISPVPTPPPPADLGPLRPLPTASSGDLGGSRQDRAPPVPEHAAGTTQ